MNSYNCLLDFGAGVGRGDCRKNKSDVFRETQKIRTRIFGDVDEVRQYRFSQPERQRAERELELRQSDGQRQLVQRKQLRLQQRRSFRSFKSSDTSANPRAFWIFPGAAPPGQGSACLQ